MCLAAVRMGDDGLSIVISLFFVFLGEFLGAVDFGGVIATDNAVIPAAVGVDIGCGMIATETDIPAAITSSN